jgi:DNA-binding beta-propeller fold protein YncE
VKSKLLTGIVLVEQQEGDRVKSKLLTGIVLVLALALAAVQPARATETENLNIRILPPPAKVVVDGKVDDWDLSAGVLVCGDVENLRDKMAVWIHAMNDADNLYVLARFIDETPMSHPGSIAGDYGFLGDSLQLRIILKPDAPDPRGMGGREVCWVTAWRDRDAKDVVNLHFPRKQEAGGDKQIADAKKVGAQQAFLATADGKGYVQEMAIPWKLLADGGLTPRPGERIVFSVEPNFNTSAKFRITLKDIFRPGIVPDRVFTFTAVNCWGYGKFEPAGKVEPQPLRLADNREFKVTMQNGLPAVDWTGLFEEKKMEGFAKISLDLPEDGYVSLNIKDADGQVVRHLLTANFLTKGKHELLWDGLTTMSHMKPGELVPAGDYSWEAIYHTGIGLRLVGWAHNSGKAPFDSPGGNWGGDMAPPISVAADAASVYLGWAFAEAGKAVVCADFDGNVKWRHSRGGFGGAVLLAASDGVVYVYDEGQGNVVYRLDAVKKAGEYSNWEGTEDATLALTPILGEAKKAESTLQPTATGMAATGGKLFLSYGRKETDKGKQVSGDALFVLDAKTGKTLQRINTADPQDLKLGADGKLYLLDGAGSVSTVDPATGTLTAVVKDVKNARSVTADQAGNIYVGTGNPDNQVKVFAPDGKPLRAIGKAGGRPLLGLWDAAGMRFIAGIQVDTKGKLWVMEYDGSPRRISRWDAATGAFAKEFFGPTTYGAGGGAISPDDPLTMVGAGCEWRLDEKTGKAACVGVFHRDAMYNARFGKNPAGRLYVVIGLGGYPEYKPVFIYERLGAGQYKLRAKITALTEKKDNGRGGTMEAKAGYAVWSDANDDQQEQPEEVRSYKADLGMWLSNWYMPMTQTMIFYGGDYRLAPTGWTACGAPLYDFAQAKRLPAPDETKGHRGVGMGCSRSCGSEDGRLVLYNGPYGEAHTDFPCYNIETGKLLWSYPNNYVGVHGGHRAPPPQTGMIRAAYDILGTGKLPEPIGDIFVIATDKGEWHILTGAGFYLTKLFEADALKIRWPDPAVPGAIMDTVPPGMGAEDFGGSMTVGKDGQLYVQHGKTAFINSRVVGLDSVRKLPGGKLTVAQADLAKATAFREKFLQASVGAKMVTAKKATVTFTGDLRQDFATQEPLAFQKTNADRVEAAIAWSDANLYLAWQVSDATPWVNGAGDAAQMYAMGDTVDFQLATDPKADPKRDKPVLGDLRLSIGNLNGKSTAVVYRPVAKEKAPKKFFSGVWRDGVQYDSVLTLSDAKIEVKVDAVGKRYLVEAAIPLAALGLKPAAGLTLSGDFGATFGEAAGKDTVLRSYWNNQATGIVADEVAELQLEPKNWGRLIFE